MKNKAKKDKELKKAELLENKALQQAFNKRVNEVSSYFKNSLKGAEKFDQYLNVDLNETLLRARKLLDLNPSETNELNPVVILLPQAFNDPKNLKFKQIKKTDFMRFNESLATALLFGEETLYYYQVKINHTNGSFSDDHILEIPYSIITTVEVRSARHFGDEGNHHLIDLQLGILSQQTLSIRFKDFLLEKKELENGVKIPQDTLETLQGIQKFLRVKRGL